MPPHRLHAAAAAGDDGGLTMRSLLFVPGDDDKKLAKALTSGADALIVDLEDSVAEARKPAARASAAAFLAEARRLATRPRLYVRVNPFASGLTAADLDAVIPAAPDGIVLPKSRGGADVQRLGANLAVREAEHGLADGSTRVIAIATESARALFGFASYRGASGRLEGLAWGGEDLSADLGAETNRLPDGAYAAPYALARTLTLVGAVAAEARPIDAVMTNFRDLDGLRAEALAARRDGFVAKMAIHPAQVPIINEVFSVSPEAIARARAVVAAFEAAPGAGVVALDGEMLDLPHLKRAKRLLEFGVRPSRAPRSDRAADLETDRAFCLADRNDAEVEHMRAERPAPELGERSLDPVGRPGDQHLDRPVATVAHPAGDAETQRDPAREVAVADALDVALDDDAPDQQRLLAHQDRLSSGCPNRRRAGLRPRGTEVSQQASIA